MVRTRPARPIHSARLWFAAPLALAVAGCASTAPGDAVPPTSVAPATPAATGAPIGEFFAKYDAANLSLSPQGKAYRGIRDADYGTWDNPADESVVARQTLLQATAQAMRDTFDPARLSPDDALSFALFDAMAKRSATLFDYRDHDYIFDQMNGAQSQLPAFLVNIHRVANEAEAEAYIGRVRALGLLLDALSAESARRAALGIMPPKWVFPRVINDIDNLIAPPRDAAMTGHVLADDFRGKLAKLTIDPARRDALQAAMLAAWRDSAAPAYARLRSEMTRQMAIAPTQDGVWRLPDGADYYNRLLASYTTTAMTADEIHNLGLSEVTRIHGEMRAIMAKVGFKGTLQQFFAHVRTDPRFYHSSREAYLAEADARLKAITAELPKWFNTLPKAPLVVKPVEAFREKSAGKAFYQSPAPDGSRPGTYYVNLYNLKDMAKTELEALAYHEGLPGHHLQRAVQTELKDLPPFRQFGGVTAYTEGWGLYSEELGKDMGFYTDPYSDFGRLGMELWRACRLVTDTGIHSKRWSREQAIAYLTENTPNPPGDIEKAIERYIIYPGQATAYTIGKLKIMELRERARTQLGDRFDVKAFHDVVLKSGPVPLDVLESRVNAWVSRGGAG